MVKIVCPTHGRAGRVKAFGIFGPGTPTLVLSESELPKYKEHYPDADYDVHPDSVLGMNAKRQWMYERYGDLLMIDDDVIAFSDLGAAPGEDASISPSMALEIVDRTRAEAEAAGAFLWGFARTLNPTHYSPQSPVGLTGFIPGCGMGLRPGSKLWWPDNGMMDLDDAWICLLNAHYHRYVWRNERYCLQAVDTFASIGGNSTWRTSKEMSNGTNKLAEAFGEECINRDRYGGVRIPL